MAKPKLALIPAAQGSKFYSVLPSDGVGDFDFTRASAATRVNKDGLIETVASGQSRLNYPLIDGKVVGCPSHILEPSRSNLITYSEDLSQWSPNGGGVTINQTISPDGTLNADKLFAQTNNGQHRVDFSSSNASGATTFSFFAKSAEYSSVQARIGLSTSYFNLEDGSSHNNTTDTTSSTKYYGNGWYRCIITKEVSSANEVCRINLTQSYKDSSIWVGDGTSGLYVWGAMHEVGSYATSIINTSGSAVTRVADNAYQQSVTQVIGQSEGTLFLEFEPLDTSALQIMFQIRNSSSSGGQIDLRLQNGEIRALGNDGGLPQFNISGGSYVAGTNYKIAVRYKLNDTKFYINGSSAGSDTLCSFGATALQNISFSDNLTNFKPSIKVKQTKLYNTALSDSELQALTS